MTPPTGRREPLWPYGKTAAILAIPLIWLLLVFVLALTERVADWPDPDSRRLVMYFTLVASLIPVVLVLLDFVAAGRGSLDLRGFKIDFGKVDIDQPYVRRESRDLPDTEELRGGFVTDSAPMQIVTALREATSNEIVRLDLKAGRAWWVTRLLALSAGAVRAGSPEAVVFVGRRENQDGVFLGWAAPTDILNAILADREEYRSTFARAKIISGQLALLGDPSLRPQKLALEPNSVGRYATNLAYLELGEAAFEQILLDQLAVANASGESLERPPDHLSVSRFEDLLGPYIVRDSIEEAVPAAERISFVLESRNPYVALVSDRRYKAMLKSRSVERLVLRELLRESQEKS